MVRVANTAFCERDVFLGRAFRGRRLFNCILVFRSRRSIVTNLGNRGRASILQDLIFARCISDASIWDMCVMFAYVQLDCVLRLRRISASVDFAAGASFSALRWNHKM